MNKKKQIRENFRKLVFGRDKHKCVFCTETENLDAHHITDRNELPNGGYVKENGITLCSEHHINAEKFHYSGKTEWVDGFHPNDLYKKINSSYEEAYKKSLKLNAS